MKRVAIIGAGSKKGREYFDAAVGCDGLEVVACLINRTRPACLDGFEGVVVEGGDLSKLLQLCEFDVAVVVLPHAEHQRVALAVLERGIYVIKEKPLALNLLQMSELKSYRGQVFTTVQRSCDPNFLNAREMLGRLGPLRSFSYRYFFALPGMTSGWRADRALSGGGVLMDMGYHIVDIVHLFFGKPAHATAQFGYQYEEMRGQGLDDRALISLEYGSFAGIIELDRHADRKLEQFDIEGENGSLSISPKGFTLTIDGVETFSPAPLCKGALTTEVLRVALQPDPVAFDRNVANVALIDSLYS